MKLVSINLPNGPSLQEYVDKPVLIRMKAVRAEACSEGDKTPALPVSFPEVDCEMFIEKNSFYAVRDNQEETGFIVIKCEFIFDHSIGGRVLEPVDSYDLKYVHLQVSFVKC